MEEINMLRATARTFLAAVLCLAATTARAGSLSGSAQIYDPSGLPFGPQGAVHGVLDLDAGTLQLDPIAFPDPYFPLTVTVDAAELLGPGSYTRGNGAYTFTVGPNQVGAFLQLRVAFGGTPFPVPAVAVWDVSPTAAGDLYTPVDSDGDGVPGHRLAVGQFVGFQLALEFTVAPGPAVSVGLSVAGGATQECSETGGAPVTVAAAVTLTGGAQLASLDWTVDGEAAGQGEAITPFLSLGSHTVSVTATTVGGLTATASASVAVVDTTPPVVEAAFVDPRTGEPVAATSRRRAEHLVVRIRATDVCDPQPVVEAVGGFAVADGDRLKVKEHGGRVTLQTSTITLSATARDASGNTASAQASLDLTPAPK
ncbi:MAG: hypothetical protein D6739_11900, partial [Nitrospirae bacterium]